MPTNKQPASPPTFTRCKWVDDATLDAFIKRAAGTTEAPKDFAGFVPSVRAYNAAGDEVAVTLCGTRGKGREMILDREVWEDVSVRIEARWFIATPEAGGEFSVATMSGGVMVKLAEHLMGVKRGDFIMHSCRDMLDMRMRSMKVVDWSKFVLWGSRHNTLAQRPKAA